jgi:hypothetical protein
MTHDPYDTDNRIATGTTPEDPYVRRPYGAGYGGSGIAFLIFGVVAILLIGFAMFGGYPTSDTVNAPATTNMAEQSAPQAQPEQPAQPQAPANNTTTNQ